MKRIFLIPVLLIALPAMAQAMSLKNRDAVAHTVLVMDGGEVHEVTLQPGGIYRTPGPNVVVEMKGQSPMRTIGDSEVVILEGRLRLMRRDSRPGR